MKETYEGINHLDEDLKPVPLAKWEIEWRNILSISYMHLITPYAIYLMITKATWQTNLFAYILYVVSLIGVTAGAHRLWSHRSYKAKAPLQIILLIFHSIAHQGSAFHWARDHRVHHKYTDTDADPHNSNRGFFYCHIGWIFLKKNPKAIAKGKCIDISDLMADRLLQLQHKYYYFVAPTLCILMPTLLPTVWGENVWNAFYINGFRIIFSLHSTLLINSLAHMWGAKPYEKDINPTENMIVSFFATGEGFHNFHHTFPQDYRAAELGGYKLNISRLFIDIMAKIGWAYDLKTVSEEIVEKRVNRTGDGSHPVYGFNEHTDLHIEYSKNQIRQKGT
ncbi:acyl-CoA Delta(11) desaturase-like [Anticarsia gemmatalis]|uniref:acyl-CoA Delta(11) desaturase-like n=1 Tax=Anticarsia gemmatalis TaxID=129554 RepID=UPI003F768D67